MKNEFYAGVWLGIQNFDTCIRNNYKIEDIIGHGNSLEQCKENIRNADIKDDLQARKFAIVKIELIEEFDLNAMENSEQ